MTEYRNIHGRRGTRGIRPWLIAPKLLAVALYLGGLMAAAVVWLTGNWEQMDLADPARLALVQTVGRLFRLLIVPAVLVTIAFGVALLLLQSPRILLRLRWLQVKLLMLLLTLPAAHLFMSSRLELLRRAAHEQRQDLAAAGQLTVGFVVVLVISAGIVVIARIKPNLRQNWAKAFTKRERTNRQKESP